MAASSEEGGHRYQFKPAISVSEVVCACAVVLAEQTLTGPRTPRVHGQDHDEGSGRRWSFNPPPLELLVTLGHKLCCASCTHSLFSFDFFDISAN